VDRGKRVQAKGQRPQFEGKEDVNRHNEEGFGRKREDFKDLNPRKQRPPPTGKETRGRREGSGSSKYRIGSGHVLLRYKHIARQVAARG